MKKLLTLALALALVTLGSVSWAATRPKSSRIMQKGGPPKTDSISLNSSRSNVYRVKVTQVNKENKTFTVEVTFSAAKLEALPKVGDVIATTYNPPIPGGPPEATTIKGSKSNSSERVAAGQSGVTGKVTQVNAQNKTFAVEVAFSAKNLKNPFPKVGEIINITYTQATPGGPLEVITLTWETHEIKV